MVRRRLLGISLVAYVASLAVPAIQLIYTSNGEVTEVDLGVQLVLWGWASILVGSVAWFANPCYALGIVLALTKRARRWAKWILAVALALAASSVVLMRVPFVGDEAGVSLKLMRPLLGFWLWIGSLTLAAIGAWFQESPAPDGRPAQ